MKAIKHYRLAGLFAHPLTHRLDAWGLRTRRTSKHNLCGVVPVVFLAYTVLAQGWYTVDDFQYSPGKIAWASSLAKDPTGAIIYSAGTAVDASNVRHLLVFESADGGTNWAISDDYTGAADSIRVDGEPSIASDPAGNLYASDCVIANGSSAWVVRRLPAGGSGWVTVDLLFTNGTPKAVTTDSAGNVYFAGYAGNSNLTWLVRKGTPTSTGISWANVDAFTSPYGSCTASGVFCHPTAGVFVVGSSSVPYGSGSESAWTVRRSQDGGVTWATVDTFQLTSQGKYGNLASGANGVGADAAGNVYVVGSASQPLQKNWSSGPYHWNVRKCANPGASSPSWSIVDNFQLTPTYDAYAMAFTSDAKGNLFVTGKAYSGGWQWVTRESVGGTGTWNTLDTFPYAGLGLFVWAALGDSLGNVFVAGEGWVSSTNIDGGWHWLVRKN